MSSPWAAIKTRTEPYPAHWEAAERFAWLDEMIRAGYGDMPGARLAGMAEDEPLPQRRAAAPGVRYEHAGESLTLAEWGKRVGLRARLLKQRLEKGWTMADALTIRPRDGFRYWKTREAKHLTCQGESLTIAEWSQRTGLDATTIRGRMKRGWTAENALGLAPKHRSAAA